MKKIVALALAMMLVLAMGSVAMAADERASGNTVSFTKEYAVTHGTAPAQTFEFETTPVSYTDSDNVVHTTGIPDLTFTKAVFSNPISETTTKTVSATVEDWAVGKYVYKVKEKAGTTAGITYDGTEYYFVVYVSYADDAHTTKTINARMATAVGSSQKMDKITNTFDSGSLTVNKTIEGNLADLSKDFTFTITFTAPSGTTLSNGDIGITGVSDGTWSTSGLVYTVKLTNGESITFANLPVGTTYTVTEEAETYTQSSTFSNAEKTITAGTTDTAAFKNTKETNVDTGITLESVPYIMILAVAMMGVMVIISRKRREEM